MAQAEILREQRLKKEIEGKRLGEVARRVLAWKELPTTKDMLAALGKIEESHDKHILNGKCKNMEEYLGRCFARNKAKGLFTLIAEFEKTFKKVLDAERRNK